MGGVHKKRHYQVASGLVPCELLSTADRFHHSRKWLRFAKGCGAAPLSLCLFMTNLPASCRLSKPHAGAAAVFVDELDAGGLQSSLNFFAPVRFALQGALRSIPIFLLSAGHVGRTGQFLLRPAQKGACCLNLAN